MIKTLAYTALLLISMVAGIVAGYFNTIAPFADAVAWVFEEIQVVRVALAFTTVFYLAMIVAFFTSKGSFSSFKMETYAMIWIGTIVGWFFMLPSAIDTPNHLGQNFSLMLFLLVGSQMVVAHQIAGEFWRYGGRDSN